MKQILNIVKIFSVIVVLQYIAASAAIESTICWKNPKYVSASDEKKVNTTLALYRNSKKQAPFGNSDTFLNMYEADINNDGKIENIFLSQAEGSLGFQNITAFQKNGYNFNDLGEPPKPSRAGGGSFYSFAYRPANGQDEFLTQLCGKTYMVFDSSQHRDAYLWQDKTTMDACDSNWANYERSLFENMYKQQDYNSAIDELNFFSKKCKNKLDPQLNLWIMNDLALATLKNGDAKHCGNIINSIKNNKFFPSASLVLKKAVFFNENLCQKKAAETRLLDNPWGPNEYTWLLKKEPIKQAEGDKLLKKLIFQTTPSESQGIFFSFDDQSLSTYLYKMLASWDKNDWIKISNVHDSRFALLNGCIPGDCGVTGFIWVDVKLGTSVMGFYDIYEKYLHLSSKNYNSNTLPKQAKKDVINIIMSKAADNKSISIEDNIKLVNFYNVDTGQKENLTLNWLYDADVSKVPQALRGGNSVL